MKIFIAYMGLITWMAALLTSTINTIDLKNESQSQVFACAWTTVISFGHCTASGAYKGWPGGSQAPLGSPDDPPHFNTPHQHLISPRTDAPF